MVWHGNIWWCWVATLWTSPEWKLKLDKSKVYSYGRTIGYQYEWNGSVFSQTIRPNPIIQSKKHQTNSQIEQTLLAEEVLHSTRHIPLGLLVWRWIDPSWHPPEDVPQGMWRDSRQHSNSLQGRVRKDRSVDSMLHNEALGVSSGIFDGMDQDMQAWVHFRASAGVGFESVE